MTAEQQGRQRLYRVEPSGIARLQAEVATFWTDELDELVRDADRMAGGARRTDTAPPEERPCDVDTARARILAGLSEVALVVGGDTTPKGFLAPNAGERWDDPDWLRFRLLGMTNPAYFALYARRRMDLYGATPEDFARSRSRTPSTGWRTPTRATARRSASRTC